MSFAGAEWLVREFARAGRTAPKRCSMRAGIAEGHGRRLASGAGVGYTSLRLSKRVGDKGMVYATDLQPEMLRICSARTPARPA